MRPPAHPADAAADAAAAGARPVLARTRAELAAARAALPGPVAVVLTMGALHAGHAALVREARRRAASVVVTVFVNPLQFGSASDLQRYPRTLQADLDTLAAEGADLVFAPSAEVVYPDGDPLVRVSAGPLAEVLEGAARPGHFDGVLTVVTKLLHLVDPDVALFGQKDAQQLLLVRRMVRDLDLPVEVVGVPTVRDPDGLALSSRNAHLSADDRRAALALSRALRAGEAAAPRGADAVRRAAREVLDAEPALRVDYLALVDPGSLADLPEGATGPALLAVAAGAGGTRLIDNTPLAVGEAS
ncbi:pantoate--beta-alanine ligase [Quadrisphaera sp. DSM 44207]|uniref:pantoate--beta-alanine ligase n=1 Tax=Quadrisphaera sp. DSM 44207 TaxID=1881057 RepID=UPI000B84E463